MTKVLVHGGGGSKGAFGIGCLRYLLGDLRIRYSALFGVSVGAINCSYLAQFKHGEEKESIEKLSELWQQLTTQDIYKRWFPFGRLQAMVKSSFYDSSPLLELISKHVSLDKIRASGKHVTVGAVSMTTGKYKIFDQNNDNFIKAVVASASFPGALSPVEFDGQIYCDGGPKSINPLREAVDFGATSIDLIVTSPETRDKAFMKKLNTLEMLTRAIDLSSDKILSNDIDKVIMHNKLAEHGVKGYKSIKMNLIRPQYNLIENFLSFDKEKIKMMIDIGYQCAKSNYDLSDYFIGS
jgi:NTE family protein